MLAVLSESLAANAQINIRVYRCISPTDTALINLINCVSGGAREHFPRKFPEHFSSFFALSDNI